MRHPRNELIEETNKKYGYTLKEIADYYRYSLCYRKQGNKGERRGKLIFQDLTLKKLNFLYPKPRKSS
jgi:hypothetical protein